LLENILGAWIITKYINIQTDMSEPCHRRSSNRIAKKRSLEESHASSPDTKRYHQPTAGDTPINNDCGILPGE